MGEAAKEKGFRLNPMHPHHAAAARLRGEVDRSHSAESYPGTIPFDLAVLDLHGGGRSDRPRPAGGGIAWIAGGGRTSLSYLVFVHLQPRPLYRLLIAHRLPNRVCAQNPRASWLLNKRPR